MPDWRQVTRATVSLTLPAKATAVTDLLTALLAEQSEQAQETERLIEAVIATDMGAGRRHLQAARGTTNPASQQEEISRAKDCFIRACASASDLGRDIALSDAALHLGLAWLLKDDIVNARSGFVESCQALLNLETALALIWRLDGKRSQRFFRHPFMSSAERVLRAGQYFLVAPVMRRRSVADSSFFGVNEPTTWRGYRDLRKRQLDALESPSGRDLINSVDPKLWDEWYPGVDEQVSSIATSALGGLYNLDRTARLAFVCPSCMRRTESCFFVEDPTCDCGQRFFWKQVGFYKTGPRGDAEKLRERATAADDSLPASVPSSESPLRGERPT